MTADRMRLDAWLRARYPGLSRQHVEEAIDSGMVRRAGGGRLRKGDRVDEALDCSLLDLHLERIRNGNPDLTVPVLLETESLVVVDKPAGMPGHPVHLADFDTVSHWALARYPEIRAWASACQPTLTPHRLDTGTSGLLLVARQEQSYRHWRGLFSAGQVQKQYLAWCWGTPAADRWSIRLAVVHDRADRRRMVPAGDRPGAGRVLPAATDVTVERRLPDRFLCRAICRTGVMHQVRVHLAAAGHPLLGDELYDAGFADRPAQPALPLLRAVQLEAPGFRAAAPEQSFPALFAPPA